MRSSANHKPKPQLSILSALYCDSELVSPLIAREEKVTVKVPCRGNGINIIDCRHADREQFIIDVNGLDFTNKAIDGPPIEIYHDIPIIPLEWFDRPPESIESNIVGISLYDVLSIKPKVRNGYYQLRDDVHIDLTALSAPVFQGKRVILFCTGIDVVIEKLWWLRNYIQLFDSIAAANFHAVVGMNFSLFLGECPLGQLINLNKSLLFCQELSKRGVPVIPHVYAVNDWQREKWVQYLNENPSIKAVVINTQMQKDRLSMYETRLTVEALMQDTDVTVVLHGRNIPGQPADRVFLANQQGLKKRAIVENALKKLGPATAEPTFGIISKEP